MKVQLNRFIILLFLLVVVGCDPSAKDSDESKEVTLRYKKALQEVKIVHSSLNAYIPFSGYLRAGQKTDIQVKQRSKLIALLVDNGSTVEKGDLIAGLMPLSQGDDFTPQEIHAPFAGEVSGIGFKIGSVLSAGEILMTIKNLKSLMCTVSLTPHQTSLLKKHSKVLLNIQGKNVTTDVDSLDRKNNMLKIVIPNSEGLFSEQDYIEGKIFCGLVEGTYLPKKYAQRDPLHVYLEEGIELDISFPAVSDDLALIFPPIPDQNRIWIVSESR